METSKTSIGEQLNDLTLFAVDTLASPLVARERDLEPTTHATCGPGLEQPLAKYDPITQSWKTSEDTSLWGEPQLLATLPTSGMTHNGALYVQREWVRLIDATDLLSWPTPRSCTAMSSTITPQVAWNPARQPNLETIVGRREWPNEPATQEHTGVLNPTWVEWLMGFPIGWTDLED
jgi:hypothetical protein